PYFRVRDDFPLDPNSPADGNQPDLSPMMQRPWTAAEYPQTAAFLAANKAPLAKVVEASTRARFFYPFEAGHRPDLVLEVQLPYLVTTRHAAKSLVARAMLRAGTGDIGGADSDLLAAHRIAALLTNAPTLVDRIVG